MSVVGFQKAAKNNFYAAFLIFSASISSLASAFPEMIRYGFQSCQGCHYNPNGGGILTPSGRILSKTLLSRESGEDEEKFLYGVADQAPPWINFGGDLRLLQVQRENARIKQGRFIVMQADIEAAVQYESLTVVASLGQDSLDAEPYYPKGRLISRRHYVLWQTPVPNLQMRAGRFDHPFGIYVPDHIIATRAGLNWSFGSETYNLESIWQDPKFDVFVTLNFGRPDDLSLQREKGVVSKFRYNLLPKAQVGVSYYYGTHDDEYRHVYGPHVTIAFSDKIVLLEEIALQEKSSKNEVGESSKKTGLVNYTKVSYEVARGINVFALEDFKKSSVEDPNSAIYSYGLGTQYIPRPHLEFVLSFQRYERENLRERREDLVYLMMHAWL